MYLFSHELIREKPLTNPLKLLFIWLENLIDQREKVSVKNSRERPRNQFSSGCPSNWTFFEEIQIPEDVAGILAPGEQAYAAFKTFRDSAIFTSKRLIVRDAQGFTGKKVEIYSLSYSSVVMWSTENAGTLDLYAEVQLWTKAGRIKISLDSSVDVRRIDTLMAHTILQS